ncbi:hypothetical protein ACGFX4_40180 [Kitasatospora sp. NPDC048365]|uniref:hypothetical protein n=1 Tax=Kitasatospora sp. NPDC048365 TaxID=3364050 RepID=UPI0037121076
MALVEVEFAEGIFHNTLLLMLTEAPIPVPTFQGLPDDHLITGIDWGGTITFDATPDGSPAPPNTMTARVDVTIRHIAIAELEADPNTEEASSAAVFWLHLWVLGPGLVIDLSRVDIAGQAPQDVGRQVWKFTLNLNEVEFVTGSIHHADRYVTLRLATTGADDLSAPPANHLKVHGDHHDFLVRISGEAFADGLASQVTRQLATLPQGMTVQEYPHAAWGNWAPMIGWRPDWAWAAVANCRLNKQDACPALFEDVDVSVEAITALSVEILPPQDDPDGPQELEQTLHLSGDASDRDAFSCFMGTGGMAALFFGVTLNPVVGVIVGVGAAIALGEILRGRVGRELQDLDVATFTRIAVDDHSATYKRRSPLPDVLQRLSDLHWTVDQNGLMISGKAPLIFPAHHVPDFKPPPGPLPGDWAGGRYNCEAGQWEPHNRYTLRTISLADRAVVLDQPLLDTKVEIFSVVVVPPGPWQLTWFPAGDDRPNPQVMVSSNGLPAEGASGRVYVHTNVGLARYEIVPVPPAQQPSLERLLTEKIKCAKQAVRVLKLQGEPSEPALVEALITLSGLLSQAGQGCVQGSGVRVPPVPGVSSR